MSGIKNILKTESASFGYLRQRVKNFLLKDIDLEIDEGELVCMLGINGSGKSTFLKTISSLIPQLEGNILLKNRNLKEYSSQQLATLTGYVSTEMIWIDEMSVYELVLLGRFPYTNWLGTLTESDKQAVQLAIEQVGIKDLINRKINEISDGERQRAMIARTLAQNTELILLDEPSAFLDIPNKYEIAGLLKTLCEKGKTVLFSTHDLNLALSFADKIFLIDGDKIIQGAPEDLIINGEIQRIFKTDKFSFDSLTGNILPLVAFKYFINLNHENTDKNLILWTEKSLQRIGWKMIKKSMNDFPSLTIETDNQINFWKLNIKNKIFSFNCIYELLNYLTNTYKHEQD
jgi:iron complex transport system ATP-binding protein